MFKFISKGIIQFLTTEVHKVRKYPLSDFDELCTHIQPCDVILVEGRTRVSRVVSYVTRSIWTHSALYIGKYESLDTKIKEKIHQFDSKITSGHIIIESDLGSGVTVRTLDVYSDEHIRLCRPINVSQHQQNIAIDYAVASLGLPYDNQQVFDLARFLFPWWILPRIWRSSLFETNIKGHTKMICSLLIANAFVKAKFPILPVVLQKNFETDNFEAITRNPKLFVPSDFDYSPYFEIIKYPIIKVRDGNQKNIIWDPDRHSNDHIGISSIVKTEE